VDGHVVFSDVVRGELIFVDFSRIFLLGILIFKGKQVFRPEGGEEERESWDSKLTFL
jgi:hypothetical protein